MGLRLVFDNGKLVSSEPLLDEVTRFSPDESTLKNLESRIAKLEGKPPRGTKVTAVDVINSSQRLVT